MDRNRDGRVGFSDPSTGAESPAASTPAGSPPAPGGSAPTPAETLADYDYSNFYWGSGDDAFVMLEPFEEWWRHARPWGYYLFGQPLTTAPRPVVDMVEAKNRQTLAGLVNLASYNYLGLSYRPEVIAAAQRALARYGLGASGSPILSGMFDLHERLAEELARYKHVEAALLFPTGYGANLGVISGIMRPGDWVVCDQYSHASIVDGIILSKATPRFFRHNDADDLDRKLRRCPGKKLVVVEGVYSMDGDVVDLPAIVDVCERHGARILIDEAHSMFLYGPSGRGIVEHFGLEDRVDIHFGTFSKSLGGVGGYVAGSRKLINYLRGFARSYVFSCAMPPAITAGLLESLAICAREPDLRSKLWSNTAFLRDRLSRAGVDTGTSTSQVVPVFVRDDQKIFKIAEDLIHAGVFLQPIRYPAVSKHQSRLRISVSAAHTEEQLARGADILTAVLERHGICR